MQLKVTANLWNKVLTETYDSDKVTIETGETDIFVRDTETNNVLAIYPKAMTTIEEVA